MRLQLPWNTGILTGEILPGLVGKAKVSRSLQHPEVRTRGIGKFDQDICYVEELEERNTELVGCSKHCENQGELRGIQAEYMSWHFADAAAHKQPAEQNPPYLKGS